LLLLLPPPPPPLLLLLQFRPLQLLLLLLLLPLGCPVFVQAVVPMLTCIHQQPGHSLVPSTQHWTVVLCCR
jgi:hypothetical protein